MRSPILFIIFKRADTTRRAFERIREAQPPRLYIAADGPCKDRPEEMAKCEAARKIVETIDWPCEVHRLYRDENLGCGKGVSSAISWFFEHEEEGIILEDDILPHLDFFKFCDEMLEKYRDDKVVKCICGNNRFYQPVSYPYSYYFSHFTLIWGWATWRRTWEEYDYSLRSVSRDSLIMKAKAFPLKRKNREMALAIYDMMTSENPVDTWDYQLFISVWYHDGLNIVPINNLCRNIGFATEEASHTIGHDERIENHEVRGCYPLKEPNEIQVSKRLERITFADYYIPKPTIQRRVRRLLGRVKAKIFRLIR